MRVKELKDPNDLLNIKDDECFKINFDFEIIDHWKWLYDNEGLFEKCIHPYTIIKIHNQKLLDKLNKDLDLLFVLNEDISVTHDIGAHIQRYILNLSDLKLNGIISDERIID